MAEKKTVEASTGEVKDATKSVVQMLMDTLEARDKKMSFANLEDNINATFTTIKATVKDAYENKLLSIGNSDISKSFDSYSLSNSTLNWMLWTALYSDSWVFRRAIDKPAQDEVTPGITLKTKNADQDAVDSIYEQLNLHQSDLIELLMWGALYGGSVAVMMFDGIDLSEMDKPIQFSKIDKNSKSLMHMYVTDRWYGCSESTDTVTNFKNIDFGKPVYYNITFADGKSYKIHHSYVLRYEHRTAPKLIKTGQLQGWGFAEGAHVLNELMRDDKLKGSIQTLIDKSCIEIIKMAGMRGIFMGNDAESNKQLQKRLEMVNWGRNFNSLTFLDKDDEYQMNGFSGLGGLSDLLQQNMWMISAALEMQGVLYGHLNSGFSSDDKAEERYADTILNRSNTYYRPVLTKLLKTLYKIFGIDQEVKFDFNALNNADRVDKKMDSIQKLSSIISSMLSDGYLTVEQAANAMKTFVNTGNLDFGFNDKTIQQVKAKANEESELDNVNLDEDEDSDTATTPKEEKKV